MKKVLFLVILVAVAAMSATAMAGDWLRPGVDNEWTNPANWSGGVIPDNQWKTEGAFVWGGSTNMPVISSWQQWGYGRIGTKDAGQPGVTVTQISGEHEWFNGAGVAYALAIHGYWSGDPAASIGTLHMTSGKQITPSLAMGVNPWGAGINPGENEGNGLLNIWGDASTLIVPWWADGSSKLVFGSTPGSLIDIRDDGTLVVPLNLQGTVDGYIAGGQIVAGEAGTSLTTAIVASTDYRYNGADVYVVSVVPEPGTLLLLCLGLGSVALFRRK